MTFCSILRSGVSWNTRDGQLCSISISISISAVSLATCAHGRAGDLKGAKRRLSRLKPLEERDENERVTTLTWKKRSVYLRAGEVSLPRLMRPLSSLYAQVDRRERSGEGKLLGSREEKREGKCESSARHNRRNVSRSLAFLPRLLAFDKD